MQILLVAATSMEIAPFLQQKPAADFLVTGVGCPSAVYHITKRLHQIDYDLVIQAGIAGSFQQEIGLGEVVLVEQDNFADIGISEKDIFYSVFEKGLADPDLLPFSNGWLKNDTVFNFNANLQQVKGITVNKVTDNKETIKGLIHKFHPQIESMEGAALHYVCLLEQIPFLQLRGISNFVGERDKAKWDMKAAIENVNNKLLEIYAMLNA